MKGIKQNGFPGTGRKGPNSKSLSLLAYLFRPLRLLDYAYKKHPVTRYIFLYFLNNFIFLWMRIIVYTFCCNKFLKFNIFIINIFFLKLYYSLYIKTFSFSTFYLKVYSRYHVFSKINENQKNFNFT